MGYGVAMSKRSYRHIRAEDRETLSLGLAQGHSLRMRARVLGRAPSTVSRESARNTTRGRPYRACTAQIQAAARARQPRRPRKLLDPWLWQYVRTHLAAGCSPEQIAGRLRHAYPDDMQKHPRPRPSMWGCMCCHGAPCAANCWPRCVRRARRVGLGREGQTDAARFPT